MTTTTDTLRPAPDTLPVATTPRRSRRGRFVLAFVLGVLAALALGFAVVYAYGAAYSGRVLPGVRIGSVELGGLSPADATARLGAAYAGLGKGSIVLAGPDGALTIRYDEIKRRPDVEAMVADALAVGRAGSPLERAVAEAQTALGGVSLQPRVAFDAARLSARVAALVGPLQRGAVNGSIRTTKSSFVVVPGVVGRTVDDTVLSQALLTTLGSVSAPSDVRLQVAVKSVPPAIDDAAINGAKTAAQRMVADLVLKAGNEHWTLSAAKIRGLIGFAATPDGGYGPTVDPKKLDTAIKAIAKKADRGAQNATFLTAKGGKIVGVAAGHDGRTIDVTATRGLVSQALTARAAGTPPPAVNLTFSATKPTFTADEARKTAPLMKKISTWTTYFPISDHNAFGANIWIPALIIDGTGVAPGETLDFWKAVGRLTRENGHRNGGAIINGHTEPQGALAGGICSCSTTLFKAGLRAGFEMHARKNHFYYIDRYPLGLDATVFISSSGDKQTMPWRNDTNYPVLIRGHKIRSGSRGYVRFDLYSVPNGRKVVIGTPVVKN